jgi:hypothetical protein
LHEGHVVAIQQIARPDVLPRDEHLLFLQIRVERTREIAIDRSLGRHLGEQILRGAPTDRAGTAPNRANLCRATEHLAAELYRVDQPRVSKSPRSVSTFARPRVSL